MDDALVRALDRLRSGHAIVLDDALGAASASAVLYDTKRLLAAGLMVADTPLSIAQDVHGKAEDGATALGNMLRAMYAHVPSLWDSFRFISWFDAPALVQWNAR